MTGINWPDLMRVGMHGFGLKPAEFWALTPAELELMMGKPQGVMPMGRARLEDLMRTFPDHLSETKDVFDGSD